MGDRFVLVRFGARSNDLRTIDKVPDWTSSDSPATTTVIGRSDVLLHVEQLGDAGDRHDSR